jgi:uncharacterized membrane-anchored protein
MNRSKGDIDHLKTHSKKSATGKTTSVKTKNKEERETMKHFANIANKLLKEQLSQFQTQIHTLLNRNVETLRNDLLSIESTLSTRIINIEQKFHSLNDRIDDLSRSTKQSNELLKQQMDTQLESVRSTMDLEKNKRSSQMKKLSEKIEEIQEDFHRKLRHTGQEHTTMIQSLQEEVKIQGRECAKLQDKLDQL